MANPEDSESVSVYFSPEEVDELLEPFEDEVVGDGLRSATIKEAMRLRLEMARIEAEYPGVDLDEHGWHATLHGALNDYFRE